MNIREKLGVTGIGLKSAQISWKSNFEMWFQNASKFQLYSPKMKMCRADALGNLLSLPDLNFDGMRTRCGLWNSGRNFTFRPLYMLKHVFFLLVTALVTSHLAKWWFSGYLWLPPDSQFLRKSGYLWLPQTIWFLYQKCWTTICKYYTTKGNSFCCWGYIFSRFHMSWLVYHQRFALIKFILDEM